MVCLELLQSGEQMLAAHVLGAPRERRESLSALCCSKSPALRRNEHIIGVLLGGGVCEPGVESPYGRQPCGLFGARDVEGRRREGFEWQRCRKFLEAHSSLIDQLMSIFVSARRVVEAYVVL